jgi:ribonuclease E
MKDRLKTDRARIQVGRISGFGLMEMSRQRLRPGMIEATTQACPACHGTGLIRSDDSMALSILRQIEEEGVRRRSREVLVKCPVGIANYLMNLKREHIAQIEARYGLSVRVEGDPHLISPDFQMEKFKTATRAIPAVTQPVVSVDTSLMDDIDADIEEDIEDTEGETAATPEGTEEEPKPKKKRRRRRRRSSKSGTANGETQENGDTQGEAPETDAETEAAAAESEETPVPAEAAEKEAAEKVEAAPEAEATAAEEAPAVMAEAVAEPVKKTSTRNSSSRSRSSSSKSAKSAKAEAGDTADTEVTEKAPEPIAEAAAPETEAEAPEAKPEAEAETKPKKSRSTRSRSTKSAKAEPVAAEPVAEAAPEQKSAAAATDDLPEPVQAGAEAQPEEPAKPKRKGWWSLGG